MRGEIIRDDDGNYNKRILAFLVLLVLVIIGTGVGTLGLTSDGSAPPPTPDQPVIEATPEAVDGTPTPTPTPTESGDGSSGTETNGTDEPDSRESPTPTPTPEDSDEAAVDAGPDPSGGGGSAGGSTGGDGGRGADSLDLAVDGRSVLIRVADLTPGDGSTGSVVVRNSGSMSGTLGVSNASVSDDENGLQEPERAAGDTNASGELSDHLRVRLWVEYPDGTREYLFGSANSTVSAASLDGASVRGAETLDAGSRATVQIAVSLPESAGNEVQSDRIEFAVPIVLREA
ncbi:hypothetical protein [Haloarcula salina]|uniref:Uncharacterized protein n=1 Tax=Haloarcula salina TaxID=1429914 RepID=A0AA41G1W7_9EURY|nr:hypothetical protein [Haloarcula salina]MBV0901878.1 hypothetical protein [Haloarcula salina]